VGKAYKIVPVRANPGFFETVQRLTDEGYVICLDMGGEGPLWASSDGFDEETVDRTVAAARGLRMVKSRDGYTLLDDKDEIVWDGLDLAGVVELVADRVR
jgi:hypothetical protein